MAASNWRAPLTRLPRLHSRYDFIGQELDLLTTGIACHVAHVQDDRDLHFHEVEVGRAVRQPVSHRETPVRLIGIRAVAERDAEPLERRAQSALVKRATAAFALVRASVVATRPP